MKDDEKNHFLERREIVNSRYRVELFTKMFYNRPNYENAMRVIRECKYHKRLVKQEFKHHKRFVKKNIRAIKGYIWRGYSVQQVKEELSSEENKKDRKNLESRV